MFAFSDGFMSVISGVKMTSTDEWFVSIAYDSGLFAAAIVLFDFVIVADRDGRRLWNP